MSRASGLCECFNFLRWKSSLSLGIRRVVHLLLANYAPAGRSFGCALRALNCAALRSRHLRAEVSFSPMLRVRAYVVCGVYNVVDIISFMSRSLHFN